MFIRCYATRNCSFASLFRTVVISCPETLKESNDRIYGAFQKEGTIRINWVVYFTRVTTSTRAR